MNNKEKREYYKAHREHFLKMKREKLNTLEGRAENLIRCYKKEDKKYGRGECDLSVQWLIDNILLKSCVHCGKSGWKVIGCNRLDNSKAHTMDNVEPCCLKCNQDMWGNEVGKKVYQYTLDGKLVKIWNSPCECGANGFTASSVRSCCNGGRYEMYNGEKRWYECTQHKGYRWSYKPL